LPTFEGTEGEFFGDKKWQHFLKQNTQKSSPVVFAIDPNFQGF